MYIYTLYGGDYRALKFTDNTLTFSQSQESSQSTIKSCWSNSPDSLAEVIYWRDQNDNDEGMSDPYGGIFLLSVVR